MKIWNKTEYAGKFQVGQNLWNEKQLISQAWPLNQNEEIIDEGWDAQNKGNSKIRWDQMQLSELDYVS